MAAEAPPAKRAHVQISDDEEEGFDDLLIPEQREDQQLRGDISIALVCQSNVNRSMQAHALLNAQGFRASSFGAGTKVRLPGLTVLTQNNYDFGTTYETIYNDLVAKSEHKYRKNGLIQMVLRDMAVKQAPERWQDSPEYFQIVVVFEKRVYDTVCADVETRFAKTGEFRPSHVINLDTRDSHKDAIKGAALILDLVKRLYAAGANDWEDNVTRILDEHEQAHGKEIQHNVYFY